MIMLRRVRWVGYVARIGQKRNEYRISVGKPEGKRPLDVDGRIILKCILEKWDRWYRLDCSVQEWDQCRGFVNAVMNLRIP
jgi:hypothetical protein